MKYEEYLRSATWRSKRNAVMTRAGGRCEFCGERAAHVHHVRYPKQLGTEPLSDLVAVCERCHETAHGIRWEPVMQEMIIREFQGTKVPHLVDGNGEIWLHFASAMAALGQVDPRTGHVDDRTAAVQWGNLEDDEKRTIDAPDTDGRMRRMHLVSEDGCVVLAMNCKTPQSLVFRRWVKQLVREARAKERGTSMPVAVGPGESMTRLLHKQLGAMIDDMDRLRDEHQQLSEQQGVIEMRVAELEKETAEHCTALLWCATRNIEADRELLAQLGKKAREVCLERGQDSREFPRVNGGGMPARLWPPEALEEAGRRLGLIA